MVKYIRFICLLIVLAIIPLRAQSPSFDDGPYRPGVTTSVSADARLVRIVLAVDRNYHITDRKHGFFAVSLPPDEFVAIEAVDFPQGIPFDDELVYQGRIEIGVRLRIRKPFDAAREETFTVSYQICQEQPDQLCFAPDASEVKVTLPPQAGSDQPKLGETARRPAAASAGDEPKMVLLAETKPSARAENAQAAQRLPDEGKQQGKSWIGRILKNPKQFIETEFQKKSFLLFLGVFLLGFLTSLTPCVYPVIPIVMGFVGARSSASRWKGFYLSAVFVAGLSLVYAVLGIIAALAGQGLGFSFQNPWVAGFIAAIFLAMGLSMAGFFSIPVPAAITSKMGKGSKSGVVSAFFIGAVSALIAAPCAGPVLISLLTVISESKQVFLGFWVTLTFSLGMCLIFLAVGTFSGLVSSLPKGGGWMEKIKYFFSLLLMAGGIYILGMVVPPHLIRIIWGVFMIAVAIWIGLFSRIEADSGHGPKFMKLIATLLFLLGVFFFWKGLSGTNPVSLQEGQQGEEVATLSWQGDLPGVLSQAKAQGKPVLIDFTADWCVYCKKLEKTTFAAAEVIRLLAGYQLVRLDMTTKDQQRRQVDDLKKIGLTGRFDPPTLVFLGPDGRERKRLVGYLSPGDLAAVLAELK